MGAAATLLSRTSVGGMRPSAWPSVAGTLPPAPVVRDDATLPAPTRRRTRIWEFSTNLHCSIIGTCLSTDELRQILRKLGQATADSTDHALHGIAVTLAGRHDKAAKLLHKALDQRHRVAIHQFAKADDAEALRALWQQAVRRGDIPGAYWATLTHEVASAGLIREVFGEVHMLSHLVGAANRADIQRLCALEAENATLRTRLARQQAALRDTVLAREARIRELSDALMQRVCEATAEPGPDDTALHHVAADLERRLGRETRRSAALADRLAAAQAEAAETRAGKAQAERERDALRDELAELEGALAPSDADATAPPHLAGMRILYVGGRPHQVAHLRQIAERAGGSLLHHDGGIEQPLHLLAGLASQADLLVFPVDCISHHAALTAKQLCRQSGKRFIPLRSAGATSLLVALRRLEPRSGEARQPVAAAPQ